jgi:hypothetical protein
MSGQPSNFRQQDVTRAINAAKRAGLEVVRVEVDAKTAKIAVIVKDETSETGTKAVNPFASLPVPETKSRRALKRS